MIHWKVKICYSDYSPKSCRKLTWKNTDSPQSEKDENVLWGKSLPLYLIPSLPKVTRNSNSEKTNNKWLNLEPTKLFQQGKEILIFPTVHSFHALCFSVGGTLHKTSHTHMLQCAFLTSDKHSDTRGGGSLGSVATCFNMLCFLSRHLCKSANLLIVVCLYSPRISSWSWIWVNLTTSSIETSLLSMNI
jgi:hypothetical protein